MAAIYAVPVRGNSDYARRLGVSIEVARDSLRITQEQLAERSGVSTSTVSRYETGTSDASAHNILRIARALDVPLGFLMDPPETREEAWEAVAFHRAQRRASQPEPS
jgi:transcriptional regulator with XRE-family HTH domain